MKITYENGWEYGEDDEELFELAMHDRQYRDYKSGVAQQRFLDDLQRAKADPIVAPRRGQVMYSVNFDGHVLEPFVGRKYQHDEVFCSISTPWGENEEVLTGFTGRVVEVCVKAGQTVNAGEVIAYIERSDIFA